MAEQDEVIETPEQLQEQEEVTEPAEAGSEAEKDGEEAAPEEKKEEPVKEPEGEKKEPPAWAKKRFDELTRKRIEAEKRNAYLEGQLEAMKGKQPQAEATPDADPEPKAEKYATYDEYVRAQARWEARQELKAEREREKAKEEKANAHRTKAERRERATKQATEARKKFADFDDVVERLRDEDFPKFSKEVGEAVMDSEVGAEIAYYLGTKPEEAARIAKLGPLAAAREIGKIEDKILNPPKPEPKRITSASAPVKTVGERGNAEVDPSKMSDDEWYAHWQKEQAAKRAKRAS